MNVGVDLSVLQIRRKCFHFQNALGYANFYCTGVATHDRRIGSRVRIQKPVVTYDLGKSSVTNFAKLPNYIEIKTILQLFLISNLIFPHNKQNQQ
jgi:hypothetical protein